MRFQRRQCAGIDYYIQIDDDGKVISVSQSLELLMQGRGIQARVLLDKIENSASRILPPVPVGKIVAVGLNYKTHAEESGKELPREPLLFMKPSTAVIAHMDPILLPPDSEEVHFEGELAFVIGKTAKDVPVEKVAEYILGYTILNDVTARDIQRREGKYTRAKGYDTFAPLGPTVVTDIDPMDCIIETRVNHEVRQHSPTNDMIFNPFQLLSFISSIMTLQPYDVITTGTPCGVGPIHHGDTVRISISGIGTLENPVIHRNFGK